MPSLSSCTHTHTHTHFCLYLSFFLQAVSCRKQGGERMLKEAGGLRVIVAVELMCVCVFCMLFLLPVTPAEPIRVPTGDRWPTQNSIIQGGSTCRGPFQRCGCRGSTGDLCLGHPTLRPKETNNEGGRGSWKQFTPHICGSMIRTLGGLPNHMSKYLKVITQTKKLLNEIYSIC